jgi:hypothetical protein
LVIFRGLRIVQLIAMRRTRNRIVVGAALLLVAVAGGFTFVEFASYGLADGDYPLTVTVAANPNRPVASLHYCVAAHEAAAKLYLEIYLENGPEISGGWKNLSPVPAQFTVPVMCSHRVSGLLGRRSHEVQFTALAVVVEYRDGTTNSLVVPIPPQNRSTQVTANLP